MGRFLGSVAAVCFFATASLPAWADPLTYAQLKAVVEGMGYTPNVVKDDGESSMFEVSIPAGGFDVPVAFEVSKSTRYIWARANLGKQNLSGEDGLSLLRKIGDIQPSHFWITSSGVLSMGMAIDNRDITPTHLRFVLEKVANDVANTAALWNKPAPGE